MLKVLYFFSIIWHKSNGHGLMYYPPGWNQKTPCQEGKGPKFCKYQVTYHNIPEENCLTANDGGHCSPSAFVEGRQGMQDWFTNWTAIEGPPTLPDYMYDSDMTNPRKDTPWNSPGSAMVFGEGCGVNGGNPYGCSSGPYGSCCGPKCGGYSFGKSAMAHAAEGSFDNAFVTTWQRGSSQPVYWATSTGHRGGYAYRLCKVPEGGISKVTEACFQAGYLEFDGDNQWVIKKPGKDLKREWTKVDAVRTKEGTNPEGSQWTRVSLAGFWSIKDYVKVPEALEPGMYVLSFRWDCLRTRQIWNMCANIEIV